LVPGAAGWCRTLRGRTSARLLLAECLSAGADQLLVLLSSSSSHLANVPSASASDDSPRRPSWRSSTWTPPLSCWRHSRRQGWWPPAGGTSAQRWQSCCWACWRLCCRSPRLRRAMAARCRYRWGGVCVHLCVEWRAAGLAAVDGLAAALALQGVKRLERTTHLAAAQCSSALRCSVRPLGAAAAALHTPPARPCASSSPLPPLPPPFFHPTSVPPPNLTPTAGPRQGGPWAGHPPAGLGPAGPPGPAHLAPPPRALAAVQVGGRLAGRLLLPGCAPGSRCLLP
jgi:hypothetical protein